MRFYIYGIPPTWKKENLRKLVYPYGKVNYCEIREEAHDQAERYAVVQFALADHAKEVMARLNGAMVEGYKLTVTDKPPELKRGN